MAKDYWLVFGQGDPRVNTGLSPTFLIFETSTGASTAPPTINEPGVSTGLYHFQYGATASIAFLVDGGAILASSDRYIRGVLDPVQATDQTIGGVLGTDSFGSTSVDPTTLFGYAKRMLEFSEGNAVFNKSLGTWDIYSRGSSTLLREKTLTNTTTSATKT